MQAAARPSLALRSCVKHHTLGQVPPALENTPTLRHLPVLPTRGPWDLSQLCKVGKYWGRLKPSHCRSAGCGSGRSNCGRHVAGCGTLAGKGGQQVLVERGCPQSLGRTVGSVGRIMYVGARRFKLAVA